MTGSRWRSPRMASYVPPEGARLQFTRNNSTGRIHIMRWHPQDEPPPFARIALSTRIRVLCGMNLWDAPHVAGDEFTDDDLCESCIRVLGDQSWRAFHVDNRSRPDA